MTLSANSLTRRNWLARAGLALGAAPIALAMSAAVARAAGKTPKATVNYQYTPKDGQRCGLCTSFIPGADPAGAGTCKIVDGAIPRNGWCELFSKR